MNAPAIDIEGLSPDALLALPDDELEVLVLHSEPTVFRTGTAKILGAFRREGDRLVVVLCHIDGGGEGVLMTLWLLARRYARSRHLAAVEWIVQAVTCAAPNPKLRRTLDRRGFQVIDHPLHGPVYHLRDELDGSGAH